MSDGSAIEWTDATLNPVRARLIGPRQLKTGALQAAVGWHCEHVSEACRNCYAESINRRLGTGLSYKPGHRPLIEMFLDDSILLQPLRWKRARRVFICSMTDLFADFVTNGMIDHVFAMMALCPQHQFQLLTKRPERMRAYLSDPTVVRRICTVAAKLRYEIAPDPERFPHAFHRALRPSASLTAWTFEGGVASDMFRRQEPARAWPSWVTWPLANVWVGTTVEDQETSDARVPQLLNTPAALRFLSCEPLLGEIDLTRISLVPEVPGSDRAGIHINALTGRYVESGLAYIGDWDIDGPYPASAPALKIDGVIAGGESGRGARPMGDVAPRSLRDQCAKAGTPFFFKQWGAWLPAGQVAAQTGLWNPSCGSPLLTTKKNAGRLLDGVEHNGMPA